MTGSGSPTARPRRARAQLSLGVDRRARGARGRGLVGHRRRVRTVEVHRGVGAVPPVTVVARTRSCAPDSRARPRHRHRLDRRDARAHDRVRRARRERRWSHLHGGVRRPASPSCRSCRSPGTAGRTRSWMARVRLEPLRAAERAGAARHPRPVTGDARERRRRSTPAVRSSWATRRRRRSTRRATTAGAGGRAVHGPVPAPGRQAGRDRRRRHHGALRRAHLGVAGGIASASAWPSRRRMRRDQVYVGVRLDHAAISVIARLVGHGLRASTRRSSSTRPGAQPRAPSAELADAGCRHRQRRLGSRPGCSPALAGAEGRHQDRRADRAAGRAAAHEFAPGRRFDGFDPFWTRAGTRRSSAPTARSSRRNMRSRRERVRDRCT